MTTIKAWMNHGRWLAKCPKEHSHASSGILEVNPMTENTFICPACYPKWIATYPAVANKRITRIPDISARKTARLMAEAAGEIYEIEYPDNIDAILQILSVRPVQNQNWEPGETEDFLMAENVEHAL